MKKTIIAFTLLIAAGITTANAQDNTKKDYTLGKRHEVRISASDGLSLTVGNILGTGMADGILGTKRSDEKASGVFGVGYRYMLGRFKVGSDFAFAKTTSKVAFNGQEKPSIKESDLNFMILPTGEFTYFKKGIVELYGSASAGVNIMKSTASAITEEGKDYVSKSDKPSARFAYQVNPIAIRLGNDWIGGFVEGGFGTKGFATIGLSMRF